MKRSFIWRAWHYAHALEVRLFLLLEWSLLRKAGIPVSDRLRGEIWRRPGEFEDWINLARFINPAEPVFLIDIGANVGDFTAKAMLEFPNLQAVCFEPASSNFATLEKRLGNNSAVSLHRCAVSNENTTAELYIGGRSDSLFSLEKYTGEGAEVYEVSDTSYGDTESVECRTLDSFNLQPGDRCVLLKIDIQGHEEKALAGASATLSKVDVAIVECSFANEYEGLKPSFAGVTQKFAEAGLYPVIFQIYGEDYSNYAFERDVIFVREPLLKNIWFKHYGV